MPPSRPSATEAALVNVSGLNHNDAVKQLERQGLKRVKGDAAANQIVLEAGPAAKNPDDVFTVKSQDPAPGTPVKPGMKVKLTIYTDPNAPKKQ
jgi:beta-lactam-binding protein with PASTA domain